MGNYKWRFPRLDHGQRIGSSDGGGENFRSNTVEGLVREICQNSLDAKKEGEKNSRGAIRAIYEYEENGIEITRTRRDIIRFL